MNANWTGVIPALMTEMKQDGALDLNATGKHVEACIDAGCTGFVMLGTLGENSSLNIDEKASVVSAAVEASAGRAPIISGIAEYTTDLAIKSSKRMQQAGATGLMALPAMVYEQDAREAITHFSELAAAVDLPIMIYNNRVSYKVDLQPEHFEQLANSKNIVAVKESSHDSRRMTDMINRLGDRFGLYCGVDDLALENLMFGAVGWVSGMANSFPAEAVELFNLAKAGRTEEALALYRWFMPLLHLDTHVKLVQYIKLSNHMTGLGTEYVRRPRMTLVGEERARVQAIIQAAIDSRPQIKAAA